MNLSGKTERPDQKGTKHDLTVQRARGRGHGRRRGRICEAQSVLKKKFSDMLCWLGRSGLAAMLLFGLYLCRYHVKLLFLCRCIAQTLWGCVEDYTVLLKESCLQSVQRRAWSGLWSSQLRGKISYQGWRNTRNRRKIWNWNRRGNVLFWTQ